MPCPIISDIWIRSHDPLPHNMYIQYVYMPHQDQRQHFEPSVNTLCLGHIRLYLCKRTTLAKPSIYFIYNFGQPLLPFSSSGSPLCIPIIWTQIACLGTASHVQGSLYRYTRFVQDTGWLYTYSAQRMKQRSRLHERMQGVQLTGQQDQC